MTKKKMFHVIAFQCIVIFYKSLKIKHLLKYLILYLSKLKNNKISKTEQNNLCFALVVIKQDYIENLYWF